MRVLKLTALAMLLATGFAALEPVVGLLRDGELHHEAVAEAAQHASRQAGVPTGEHGHEPSSDTPDHPHGPGHQHGTSADHCTHVHSVALFAGFALEICAVESTFSFAEATLRTKAVSADLTRPPKA
jgi:hypothetical protein